MDLPLAEPPIGLNSSRHRGWGELQGSVWAVLSRAKDHDNPPLSHEEWVALAGALVHVGDYGRVSLDASAWPLSDFELRVAMERLVERELIEAVETVDSEGRGWTVRLRDPTPPAT